MDVAESLKLSPQDIQYVVENIFLPPKLPQNGDDAYIVAHEASMLAIVADALQKFSTTIHASDKIAIDEAVKAIQRFRKIIDGSGFLNEDLLREGFYDLNKNGGFLLLHVKAQNAGIVITCDKDNAVFEPFELSPQNERVMAISGRLKRSFPASSTAVSLEVFNQEQCQAGLANTIATMSYQEVSEMKPKITKAGDQHIEERDTTAPTIVTDFLVTGLSAIGRPSQGSKIWKNTREEVLWSNADSPWHRSSVWLLVRVAIQLYLSRSASNKELYKEFMVFFMAYILQCCEAHDLPSDIYHCMMAKISKRLIKIDRHKAYPWIATVEKVLRNCQSQNEERWNVIMRKNETLVDIHPLSANEISQGRFVTCQKIDHFIEQIYSRQVIEADKDFTPPWILEKNEKDDLPSLEAISPKEQSTIPFYLSAFETWVETSLYPWLTSHILEEDTCERLYNTTEAYYNLALSQYDEDPESISIMLLVIMELWVACDKAATQHHPLILNYRSEMPHELLQSLILPLRGQMERLKTVEDYLEQRRARAYFSYPSIFHSFGHVHSFSVQYFDSSPAHQTLLRDIEQEAESARQRKKDEFSRLKNEYENWIKLYNSASHDFEDVVNWKTGVSNSEHSSSCSKCDYLDKAETLRIDIHEWPLPEKRLDAQSTVFELKVPKCFNDWRNMSSFCRIHVLGSLYGGSGDQPAEWTLGLYLPSYYDNAARTIILASTTKPNVHSHRRSKLVKTAVLQDVLVANGMRYAYYDAEQRCYISEIHCTDDVPKMCTYTLSQQCASLQDFIFRPHHKPNGLTPNHVISRQAMSPDHLSLEEFKAMASIPVGYRLGWQNILVNLHTPALDFRKLDTVLILLQTSRQAGPPLPKSALRGSHQDLDDEMFAATLLQGLRLALARISENWESFQALFAFISLGTRLLSWAPCLAISRDCASFIRDCRKVALVWLRSLQDRVKEAQDETQRIELIETVFQVALVCMASFYVDDKHLQRIVKNPEEACIMIESSIAIQSTMQFAMKPEDAFYRSAANRWHQCMYQAHQLYIEEILCGRSSWLDEAIANTWSTYPGGGEWKTLSTAADHWLVTRTVAANGLGSLNVYFNLLTAELLVNGLPLSRLPVEYERHQSYETYFGRSMVEVMPTDMPGMQFSSKGVYHDYKIYFGLSDFEQKDLLLVAVRAGEREQEDTFDLIPPRVFNQILPKHFIDDYSHWYRRGTGQIEFRPKSSPWDLPLECWRMRKLEPSFHSGWIMEKSGQFLLGLTDIAVHRLHKLLAPLEHPDYIHVIANSDFNRVNIALPRFQLEFWSDQKSDKVYSRQFRDMHIDPCQNIGVLIGLESKLVLTDDLQRRKLLLPSGKAKWYGCEDHIRVFIPYGISEKVHFYDVDTLLGRLVDNGSLQSKLIMCYLHALTSHCLPDPLTGMTGTEAALMILDSAAVRSFRCLSEENLERLYCIAKISPSRRYYPEYMRVMESTSWDPCLSSLSQHIGFHRSVQSILRQAASFKFFYPDTYIEPQALDRVEPLLEERQAIRSSCFHLFGFGAEDFASSKDNFYHGRDRVSFSDRYNRSFKIARSLFTMRANLFEAIPSNFADILWAYLSKGDSMLGPDTPLPDSVISYDAKWLEDARPLLSSHWCQLYHTLGRQQNNINTFQAMFCLAAMGYSESCNLQVIQTLVACATMSSVGGTIVPKSQSYQLSDGHKVASAWLQHVARCNSKPFSDSPDSHMSPYHRESMSSLTNRRYQNFHQNLDTAVTDFSASLQSQWICENLQTPSSCNISTYIYLGRAMEVVRKRWISWLSNNRLYDHFVEIVNVLRRYSVESIDWGPRIETPPIPTKSAKRVFFNDCDLFEIFDPPLPQPVIQGTIPELLGYSADRAKNYSNGAALVERLQRDNARRHHHQSSYVSDLEKSFEKLNLQDHQYFIKSYGEDLVGELDKNLQRCKEDADRICEALTIAMRPTTGNASDTETTLAISLFMAPRVSPAFFLRQLASKWWNKIPNQWKQAIVDYGLALSRLQRARRMRYLHDNRDDLMKELLNVGHRNWQPLDYPKSLLLEIESDILIRENQESVAANMRAPPNGKNVTMQLNMGEGKSSIIVPIIAAHLADGSRLVRVIVTKPQAKELHRILVTKLGGWLGKRVYYMPFSRSLRLTANDCKSLDSIYRDCMKLGGVLLSQPEHILSQKLMGIECLLSGREEVGRVLLDTQRFLDRNTRDIVDESDENYSVKFELIYTMGTQRPIELSPDRWILVQKVLSLMSRIVPQIQESFPDSIEVNYHAEGCFPKTRILRQDALDSLMNQLSHQICNVGLSGFPVVHQQPSTQDAVLKYISTAFLSSEQITAVEQCSFYTELTKGPLLLLRGLIAEGILGFVFEQKRWRVNYGLAPTRQPATRLAVPYRAKDSPTPRSEFSHVDVVIVLTCLSYYYGGLSDDDLFLCFEHLMKLDQAESEYSEWIQFAPSLPESFHRLVGVNIKDRYQVTHRLFPHLRYSKNVIDYFLAHIIFPREMKEFPEKLSASGWDIGQQKIHPTTGFSGTNDSRDLLPLEIEQLDLDDQLHTNALVLERLLQSENSVVLMSRPKEEAPSGNAFLTFARSLDPPVHVILDVGAQIIELTNIQVAQEWLKIVPVEKEKEAVVFFNDADELCAIDRKGYVEKLQTSAYSHRLDLCLVYLDEAHTRGTDLKLPTGYRAAVTLGPSLTKDRLVQACMRMRKLGQGQSVVFCVPEEIQTKICSATGLSGSNKICVMDVLHWAIFETYADTRRNMPLWAVQGERFERQKAIWGEVTDEKSRQLSIEEAQMLLEVEAQSMEDRYSPRLMAHTNPKLPSSSENRAILEIQERCKQFDCLGSQQSTLLEEQERELSPEMEQERQVQRPHPADPRKHSLHPDVVEFIKSGKMPSSSPAFIPAFQTLWNTSAANSFDVHEFPESIVTTLDYKDTVALSGTASLLDSYQRPVQWILSTTGNGNSVQRLVIISPHEAQELMPSIRTSNHVALHLYGPRPNLAFSSLDSLQLYPTPLLGRDWHLPSSMRLLLNVFSGQLYFASYADYEGTCKMMSLATETGAVVEADGFIPNSACDQDGIFTKSPVKFLKILLTKVRRDCEGIDKTHWGRFFSGDLLRREDFGTGADG
ncbi:hypothetical protein TGAM01_v206854 [Trichoderma gamsii]|uniref:ubiquitinyl hydrolase 1 n=1 Tax=Trichoderma gamsii TaxID=398673 RepID=A0A2P4ZIP9_9HYPO|nr:hypothetical protein TGAM01_v206854 [Trichoderma gamsii]PON24166.1 hypothetical protein TGAM01_v206854 [Trichoderma gamsii]